ncbi:MAG: DUF3857 and transglutaminase domain-containing protein [Nonlabens sp.]|nr:DUF3857 and transglutaminase domain-containing protein [Nonlabens sp.]
MKAIYFLFLVVFIVSKTTAQNEKLENISIADFRTVSHLDSNPNAIFLYKKVHVEFSKNGEQLRKVHNRILIKNEDGLRYATHRLRVYNESKLVREEIKSLKGYTYNLVKGDLKKDKLKSDAIFEEEINDKWSRKSFTLPNVQIGSIIEFEYIVVSPFYAVDDIIIQEDVPINQIDIVFSPPDYLNYRVILNPRSPYIAELNTTNSNRKINFSKTKSSVSFQETNIPAMVNEPIAGNVDLFRAKMVLELVSQKNLNVGLMSYSTNWDDVSNNVYYSNKFGKQVESKDFFQNDLVNLSITGSSEKQQLQDVINFLRSKVAWNYKYGIFTSDELESIYKAGNGNVADINLLLTAMLRSLGFDANPVLVSSKDNGIPLFPTINGFDYVIVEAIMPSGEKFLLDATEKNSAPNVLPVRALNWEGRVLKNGETSYWTDLMPKEASKDLTILNVVINKDLTITAKSQKRRTDYFAYRMRNELKDLDEDDYHEAITSNKSGLTISDLEFIEKDDLLAPLNYTYNFNYEDGLEIIGGKLFVLPMFHETTGENPFKLDERTLPVDLNYPISSKSIVSIKIPKGYVVESLPESVKATFNENQGIYSYIVEQKNDIIQVNTSFDLTQYLIFPKDYKMFKNFFSAMVDKENEKIVLKKA